MRRFSFKTLALTLALVASGAANAVPIDLGTLDSSGEDFGRNFARIFGFGSSLGNFTDAYTFNLSGSGVVLGGTFTSDWGSVGLTLNSISLYTSGGSLLSSDGTPGSFNFGALGAGNYNLYVGGNLTDWGLGGYAEYSGTISAKPLKASASVPEPGTLALFGMALLGLGLVARRRA